MSERNPNTEREAEPEQEPTRETTPESEPESAGERESAPTRDAAPEDPPEPQAAETGTGGSANAEATPSDGEGANDSPTPTERNVTNPETKSRLDEVRLERQREEQQAEVEETQKKASARQMLADEEQPDPDDEKEEALQDLLETTTVEFRGREFDFAEFGDTIIEAQEFSDIDAEEGSKAANFVYRVLGKKCVSPSYADEDFWRNFDFGSEDGNGILNLFNRLVEETQDVSEEERERIEEFRNQ